MRKNDMPEYKAWKAMKSRCYAPCNENMGKYKENKITVCDRWINDFDAFYKDMGKRPSSKHSVDRINTLKGYSPDNCRWTTQDIQCKNRGTFNLIFTHEGESLVLKDWAKKFGIKYGTLWLRIYRNGLSFEQAIKKDAYNRLVEINEVSLTVKEWCIKLNLNSGNVYSRINRGMKPIDALTKPFIKKGKNNYV
jgi:hypothetical protein